MIIKTKPNVAHINNLREKYDIKGIKFNGKGYDVDVTEKKSEKEKGDSHENK